MNVITEKAQALLANGEWIVRHIYRMSEYGLRTTVFYPCANETAAKALEFCLNDCKRAADRNSAPPDKEDASHG